MQLLIAYIQPHRLNQVKQQLFRAGIKKMSVTTAKGCGQQMGFIESYRGIPQEVKLLDKIRIEIGLNDSYVDPAVQAIREGAESGQIGDGKIFVLPLSRCIRIRSGETDKEAIG